MKYDKEIHHRQSIRLKDYDYSQEGAYFVTICTQNRECLFGEIIDSKIKLSSIGEIVQIEWQNIPHRFSDIRLDEFVIMPNHIHGIIIIQFNPVGATLVVAQNKGMNATLAVAQNKRAGTSPAPTLGDVVGSFKSMCVHRCINNGINVGKLWQRNYYEHVIRDETDLNTIRQYIIDNPFKWHEDTENPKNERKNRRKMR